MAYEASTDTRLRKHYGQELSPPVAHLPVAVEIAIWRVSSTREGDLEPAVGRSGKAGASL